MSRQFTVHPAASRQNAANHLTKILLQTLASRITVAMVDAHLMKHRGVDVGHVMAVFDGVETQLIGRAVHDPTLHTTAGHPAGEAVRVMVATRATDVLVTELSARRPTKFRPPDDEGFIKHPPLLEVAQKTAHRLVHFVG